MQRTQDEEWAQKKQAKKPYTRPAFRFERDCETSALICKKMGASANAPPITARFAGFSPKGPSLVRQE